MNANGNGNGNGKPVATMMDAVAVMGDTGKRLFDPDAEASLLASIMMDPDVFDDVVGIVSSDDFFVGDNRRTFSIMAELAQAGAVIDYVTIMSAANDRGWELSSLLTSLLGAVATSLNARRYANIVKAYSVRRSLVQASSNIADLAINGGGAPSDLVARAEDFVARVTGNAISDDIARVGSVVADVINEAEERMNKPGLTGIPSGLTDLDRILNGFQRSDLILLAGRPGMGKTSLGLQFAAHAAIYQGKSVLFFSLEMSKSQLTQRLLSGLASVDNDRLARGQLVEGDWDALIKAAGLLSDSELWIDDTPSISTAEMMAKARRQSRLHGVDMVVVDYLQLIGGDSFQNRNIEVGRISQAMKTMARELDIPVIALSQLSRGVESRADKHPMLSDLRDSGSLEQDADVVLFVYRDEYYNPETTDKPGVADIAIAKQRKGATGMVHAYFHAPTTQFGNLEMIRQDLNDGEYIATF